jgi:signal transduction histidine kinase
MNKIIINIVLTVTLSLFGFGWLIDKYANDTSQNDIKAVQLQTKVLNGIAYQLSLLSTEELKGGLSSMRDQFSLDLSLENAEDYAFHQELLSKLQHEGLSLGSEHGAFVLRSIANHPKYLLKLSLPKESTESNILDLTLTLLLYLGMSIVVVLWMLPLIKRLSSLTKVAGDFGSGNLSARVRPGQYSQIKLLETSFNKMASQIEQLIEENRLLANSLSHDLRTPLACFRFGLDASLHESDLNKKNHYIKRMESDLENMENMLNAFLDYASMERMSLDLDYRTHNLSDFMRSLVNDIRPLAIKSNKQISLISECVDAAAQYDSVWMYRAFANLLSNAIEYANQHVTIILTREHDQATSPSKLVCYICDDGPGIPDEQLSSVFKAFVRLDSSRERNSDNFGLGLAIVQRVMEWHNFEISFLDKAEVTKKASFFTPRLLNTSIIGAAVKVTIS